MKYHASHVRTYEKNRERYNANRRAAWRLKHPPKPKAELAPWRARNRQRVRDRERKSKYGVTARVWEILAQFGCSICGGLIRLAVDHDHATGRVRGALCARCNAGIAMFKDSPEKLRAAISYLARNAQQ